VASSSQYIVLLSQKSGEVLQYLHKEGKNIPVRHVKISHNKIYAAFEDGEIVVWDLDTKEIICSLDLHKSTVASIALSEDEVRMVSGGFDGNIIIWDMLS
jgi:WD40 repeat protein